jgi:SAF domain
MVSLGVVLVVVGALAGWRYVASSSSGAHAYLAVYQPVSIGEKITSDDLQSVTITSARGLTPIPAAQASRVIGEYAKVDLVPGTLLTDGDLASSNAVGANQALIGLQLSSQQRPARALKPGDRVLLISVPPAAGVDASIDPTSVAATMPVLPATVIEASAADDSGDAVIDVVIPVQDASVVASFANQGRVAAVLVSEG